MGEVKVRESGLRVGVLTFHRSLNYGSVLQAYALTRVLGSLGHKVEVIDYAPAAQAKMYSTFEGSIELRSLLRNLRRAVYYPLLSARTKGFAQFRERHLPLSEKSYRDFGDFESLGERYDVVICGSDQIWNVNCADFSDVYLLPFSQGFRKVAYGPSLNRGDFAESENRTRYASLLRDFDWLSVRESSGKQRLESLVGDDKPVKQVLDPTLLLSSAHYEDICSSPVVDEPYIFLFTVNFREDAIEAARVLAAGTGLPVVTLFTSDGAFRVLPPNYWSIRVSRQAKPEDFLSLVRNASYVVTNSFHGTAFSIIFRKEFFATYSSDANVGVRPDLRIADLLSMLELKDRAVCPRQLGGMISASSIDYHAVEYLLAEHVNDSMSFLGLALA
ncbi:MAG: polysaccharide pyruvyl transferase family protein [Coriobacteriia bacterium]|nr:polysaccharide pyruvyl transferase family protein [Coriobacteriia bacterium]